MTSWTRELPERTRRQELFVAEMKLNSVLRHLRASASWAIRLADQADFAAIQTAYAHVQLRLFDVIAEDKALRG